MKILGTVQETKQEIRAWKKAGLSVGLVPTMGFLHEGHLSLIQRAKKENDKVVVSIFVNPTQFGKGEDLESYPRDLEKDAQLCEAEGVDLIFHPTPEEMYPTGFHTYVNVETLSETLCGKSRPTHFRGVCTVVSKLFHIAAPDRAYFGQKDAQQLAIVKRMVRDLDFDVEVIGCPIIRESDGLAKSSRNTYLNEEQRRAATVLHRALLYGETLLRQGQRDVTQLEREIRAQIEKEPLAQIDYVQIVDALSMQPVPKVEEEILVALAVRIGNTRLIDNLMFTTEN